MSVRTRAVVAVVTSAVVTASVSAATLTDYNVVVTGTLDTRSHVDGKSFVNNLKVTNSPVFAMNASAGTGDTLTIAGTVTGNAMHVNRGVVRTKSALPSGFTLTNASAIVDSNVSIADLANQINSYSAFYSAATTSTAGFGGGAVTLVEGKRLVFTAASNSAGKTALFTLNASKLSLQNLEFAFDLGTATSAVVNVIGGTTLSPNQGNFLGNRQVLAPKLLWNFSTATTLNLNGNWVGSILGPNLLVNSNNQNIEGGVFVKNFNQTGEVHNYGFLGAPPASGGPTPPSTAIPLPAAASAALVPLLSLALRRRR